MKRNSFRHNLGTSCVKYVLDRYKTNLHPRWDYPELVGDATGAFKLNLVPGGAMPVNFTGLGTYGWYWTSSYVQIYFQGAWLSGYNGFYIHNGSDTQFTTALRSAGLSIRLCLPLTASTPLTPNAKDLTVVRDVFTDYNGNKYDGVKIGGYIWLRTNLKTTKSSPTTSIPYLPSGDNPWYTYYDNNSTYRELYGALYSGKAMTAINDNLPPGWKVPSASEYDSLITYLYNKVWCQNHQISDISTVYNGMKVGRMTAFFSSTLTPWNELTIQGGHSEVTMPLGYSSYTNRVISVSSTYSWMLVLRDAPWITSATTHGQAGSTQVYFDVEENPGAQQRTGYLDFYINEERLAILKVVQDRQLYLQVSTTIIELPLNGLLQHILNIYSRYSYYSITVSDSWIQISDTFGAFDSEITVSAAPSYVNRSGSIYIKDSGGLRLATVAVRQENFV